MKNILLAGASRGLGLEICKLLLAEGYGVYAVSRTRSPEILKLEGEFPRRLHFKSADLSNPEKAAKEVFSGDFLPNKIPISGYVGNAAKAYDDLVSNLSANKLRSMFELNVFSHVVFTRYAIRNMIYNRCSGSIVYVSSVCAHSGYKGLAMYAASKGAIEAFSKSVAREWGRKGIRSNVVAPGFMETDMSSSLSEEQRRKIYSRSSIKGPTDILCVAKTCLFLLSDAASSISGQSVIVDSGTV